MKQTENRKNPNHKNWKKAVVAFLSLLTLFFIHNTSRLYAEKMTSVEDVAQWRREQAEDNLESESQKIEYQGKIYRRNAHVKAILCMGIDRPQNLKEPTVAGSGGQADAIFLVAQDIARDKVRILMIPRDTMTEITLTDLSGNILGRDIQHLTLAYAYGDGREKSCRYMTEAVSNLLGGLSIDGYMAVSMSALPVINDGVGGVAVTIENQGMEQIDPEFICGNTVTLMGRQAEAYIRYRDTGKAQSALDRAERQKSYIQGFLRAAVEKAGKGDSFVPGIMNDISPYMVTDMSKDRYMDMALAFLGSGQDVGAADMITLPGQAKETPIYDEYHPDQAGIQSVILDMFYRQE